MSDVEEFGAVEKSYEETEFVWKINDFFSVSEIKDDINCPSFSFGNTSWYLQLAFRQPSVPGFMVLYLLKKKGKIEYSVEFNIGLKKRDGGIEHLNKGIFERKNEWIGPFFIKYSEVQQRKSELVPSGVFIITCKLKSENSLSNMSRKPGTKLEKLIKLDTLSEDLKSFFTNKDTCDTTLYVKDKEFKVHRTLLMARSPVFAAMFQHETSEKQTGRVTIPDCDPNSFDQFLEFLYSGKLEKSSSRGALNLYETSEKYDVQELKKFCSEFLIENLTAENLCNVVILADKYDDMKLQSAVQGFFNENLRNVLQTSEWSLFMINNQRLANKLLLEMSKMKDCS